MKITAIDACVLTVPTSKQMALEFPHHKLVVAEIATDEGVRGLGYSLVFGGGGAESVLVYLETRLKPLLIGEDPLAVERLWEKMYRGDRGVRRVGIAGMALSALDIGLWDIAGKAAKLPLYKLWGAVTDRVACYGSGGWGKYTEKDLLAEAERYAGMGCRYYKMKIHDPDPLANRKRVETVKKALGPGVRMMVDVNQKLDVLGNQRQAAVLEDLDLVWYEEPVIADDIAACAEVAQIDKDSGGDRRKQLHALRIPRADRAQGGALPDARRVPRQRLQRDAQDRAPRRRPRHRRLAARRVRDLDPDQRRDLQRFPRRTHGLDAAGPLRRTSRVQGRPHPHSRPAGAWHDVAAGRCREISEQRYLVVSASLPNFAKVPNISP